MRVQAIRERLAALGALPEHQARVLRDWVQGAPRERGRRRPADYLPKAVREALPRLDLELASLATVIGEHPAEDGSARLLVGLDDGQAVETVLLPRDGVCVSSQVGCAVGCQFYTTRRDGLLRQVTSGEIVAQVVLARRLGL